MSHLKVCALLSAVTLGGLCAAASGRAQLGPHQCTLDGSIRKAALAEVRAFLTQHRVTTTAASLTFEIADVDKAGQETLAAMIDRERLCCADLSFDVAVARQRVRVTITGEPREVLRLHRLLQRP